MIEPQKLFQLSGGQKRRKLALSFGALERDIAGIAEKGAEYSFLPENFEIIGTYINILKGNHINNLFRYIIVFSFINLKV